MDFDSCPQFGPGLVTNRFDLGWRSMTDDVLRPDWLERPRAERFDARRPDFDACMAAHARAVEAGSMGYADPETRLFVMTAVYLRDRGWCCDRGCRHCPYGGPVAGHNGCDRDGSALPESEQDR